MGPTPIFEELCQEHMDSGATHPLADVAEPDGDRNDTAPDVNGQERSEGQEQSSEANTGWAVPEERVA